MRSNSKFSKRYISLGFNVGNMKAITGFYLYNTEVQYV